MSVYPRVSCIMPTRNRRKFIAQATSLFLSQDYPNKELLIIDDGYQHIEDLIPYHENIHHIEISSCSLTIGMKRNIACSLAGGELIVGFDDDDYYGPERLSKQAAPLLAGEADCSAMRMSLLLDAHEGTLWACSEMTHKLCFKQDIHYGTLMFKASYWHASTHYPSVNIGEDRRFVHALLAQNVSIARIVDPASYIYVLHGSNTTSDMRLVHPDGWEQVPLEQYIRRAEDRAFYQAIAGGADHGSR